MSKANHIITIITAIILIFCPHFVMAQTAGLMPMAVQQFFDSNGNPLSAGTVTTYVAGTSTLKTTWRDAAETIANTNPIVLDAGGKAIIFGDGNYRQLVKDRVGNTIWDAVTSAFGTGSSSQLGDGTAVGTVLPWAGLVAPVRYAFAYGQELSRVTYARLYEAVTLTTNISCTASSNILSGVSDTTQIAIGAKVEATCVAAGTTVTAKSGATVTVSNNASVTVGASAIFFPWGNGNGTTTFNLPDLRGRVLPGRDNMGGTAAARLTTAIYGAANPDSLGGAGGSQSRTLLTANLPAYTPTGTVTDSGHVHPLGNNMVIGASAISAGQATVVATGGSLSTASGTANSTFAGVAQGGVSTAFAIVPPSITLNYIVKILPDVNISTTNVVTSLGGMVGDVTCGAGVTCSAQEISVQAGVGLGNVLGPANAVDNAVARFDGITGKIIQNSLVTISDAGTLTIAPTSALNSFGLVISQPTVLGGDSSSTPYALNSISIGGFNQSSYGMYLQRNLAAGSWIYPQTALTTYAEVLGNPSGTTAANDIVSVQGFARGSVPVTAGNFVNLFGANYFTEVLASATGYQYLIGAEMDVGIRAGGTAVRKIGSHVLSFGTVAGTAGQDTAYNIAKFDVSSPGWHYGIGWNSDAFHANAVIIGGVNGATSVATTGIDFTGITFSGNAIASAGFLVSKTGAITTTGLPTSAGGGGLYICIDTSGVMYKKSVCP